ncbi:MAG: hypothetical protein K6T37_04295 [Acidothermus cellulolyticus]|nr:hypothetical protein [Acidothermus cellulolyticus]
MTVSVSRATQLRVVVREETPILPRIAFVLISVASIAGAVFTGTDLGVHGAFLIVRWFALWVTALAGGFLAWRLFYLRTTEADAQPDAVSRYNTAAISRAAWLGRFLAIGAVFGSAGPWAATYLADRPALRVALSVDALLLAIALAAGIARRSVAFAAVAACAGQLAGWAYADAGLGVDGVVRLAHLTAFTLWLGGALWNIAIAMPVGRQHATIDAVIVQAHQLDRFRWVVRVALPTIIGTGLVMAGAYRTLPMSWWSRYPGVLIPIKVAIIVALVVVFITCPLFRQCSPVKGVCAIEDLSESAEPQPAAPRLVDNRRVPCAIGLIRADEAMRTVPPGAALEIRSRDVYAPIEIRLWAERHGYRMESLRRAGIWPRRYHVFIVRRPEE